MLKSLSAISLRVMMKIRFLLILLVHFTLSSWAQSNSDTLRKHVVRLSTLPYGRSAQQAETLYDTKEYLLQNFRQYTSHVYIQPFTIEKQKYSNIICSFGPDTAARIIVGAHYDTYKNSPGADNNASGVAALIELCRLFSKAEKALPYRIDIVAFAPSEPPFFNTQNTGSYFHAKSMVDNKIKVLGMININCIGYFSDQKKSQRYPFIWQNIFYTHKGNFISMLKSPGAGLFGNRMKYQLKLYARDLPFKHFSPPIPFPVLRDGDYISYSQLGIPSILISNTLSFRNKYLRYDVDTFGSLDYIRMSKTVNMIYMALIRYRQ